MPIKDINELRHKFNLSEDAIKLIENVRNSQPARRVQSNGRNVPGFYPSKKMGVTIQFESHKLELAAIYEKEHTPNVIEYYDQPPSFNIKYDNPEGSKRKTSGHRYTADFFVIEKDWIGWEEWKTDEELIKLTEKNPNRYTVDENGNWRCPPAERYARQYGLSFRVRSSKEIDWTYQRNLRFLEDFLLEENPHVSVESSQIIKKLIGDRPHIMLNELLTNQTCYTADDIYTMIATEEIFVDIYEYLIVDFDKFPLFLNKETYLAYKNLQQSRNSPILRPSTVDITVGNKINWDGKVCTIINIGENVITLLNNEEKPLELPKGVFKDLISKGAIEEIDSAVETHEEKLVNEIIRGTGEKELEEANRRYFIVQGMLNGGTYSNFDISERTIRDWMKKYRDAEKTYGNGYVGLISKRNEQGNRERKLPEKVIELMSDFIVDNYETIIQKKAYTVYEAFKQACKNNGYPPPSFKTFTTEIKKRPIYEQTKKRQGSKAAYKYEPFYYELEMTTPRHGDRPFEICHIDHTELDIQLICSQTGENLGKAWVTFLVDAYSRRILAFYLTFDPPSYRSNMMVLRNCVMRHSKLPDKIVVDGGKDFQSVYFETLLARYNKLKEVRPGAKPRFGSVCERLFGTTNEMFIHNLLGNTKIMKNYRQVTKEVNPQIHAVWTLEDLTSMLEEWCYEVYDVMPHSALDESPREAYVKMIAKTGERKNTFIKYDETFKMLTLPTTTKGTAKVVVGRGVKINYFYYWSEVLLHPDIEGTQVPIRYDPFNVGIAYAYVKNYWVELTSEHFNTISNRTEKELKLVTAEIKKRKKMFGIKKSLSSSIIVDFLQSAEAYEVLRSQQLKDQAVKRTFTVIEGGEKEKEKSGKGKGKTNVEVKVKNQIDIEVIEKKAIAGQSVSKVSSYKDILRKMKEKNSFEIYKEL